MPMFQIKAAFIGPLKKQSEDAKKYLEYRDTLKFLEINSYIYQFDHTAQMKEEINTRVCNGASHCSGKVGWISLEASEEPHRISFSSAEGWRTEPLSSRSCCLLALIMAL